MFSNLTLENLQFLTIDQTLADIATVINDFQIELQTESLQRRKVVLYGFGTGASYAVWLRKKYPHLVDGVIAHSPILNAVVDFGSSYIDIAETVTRLNPECGEIIGGTFDDINTLVWSEDAAALQNYFNLYEPVNLTDSQEVSNFYLAIASIVSALVQDQR